MKFIREDQIDQLSENQEPWDVLVIGGGASGLGVAVDAASRGHRTLLLEQHDFAKGTSSRSTKLVHGGVRYLQQGNIALVMEALRERGRLCINAPHLVHHRSFVVPVYSWWEGPFYGVGMKLYDRLAGDLGLRPSRTLTREETLRRLPTLEPEGLRRGVIYYDGQFDDARLAMHLAMTAADRGACVLNYFPVVGLIREKGVVAGVLARDAESGREWEIRAHAVINATGAFTDHVRKMDDADAPPVVTVSQGTHIVLSRSFHPGESAIMIPHTADGRVLFAVPWHDHVVVGTTDVGVKEEALEPRPMEEELEFLLDHSARYLTQNPERSDVLSVFSGLRALVNPAADASSTAALSREHAILISPSGLLTLTGGKWTTYRKMAEDTVDQAEQMAGLRQRPCITENLPLHGSKGGTAGSESAHLGVYGSDARYIQSLGRQHPAWESPLHAALPYIGAEVIWAVRAEMARTVEDVLARRTRALFLNARAAAEMAPAVAELMAQERGWDDAEKARHVQAFVETAQGYWLE